jgi:hypothetical protein
MLITSLQQSTSWQQIWDYTTDMPEVAMHICAATEGETAAVIHVQLALCTAAAVERHHLGPPDTTRIGTPVRKLLLWLLLTQAKSAAEQFTLCMHCTGRQ